MREQRVERKRKREKFQQHSRSKSSGCKERLLLLLLLMMRFFLLSAQICFFFFSARCHHLECLMPYAHVKWKNSLFFIFFSLLMMSALFQMITIIEVRNEGTFLQVLNFFFFFFLDVKFL